MRAHTEMKKHSLMVLRVLIENLLMTQPPKRDAPPPAGITIAPKQKRILNKLSKFSLTLVCISFSLNVSVKHIDLISNVNYHQSDFILHFQI